MILADIVAMHKLQLSGLAKSWLASGAEAFGVWENDRPLFSWPSGTDTLKKSLSADISVGGKRLGALIVHAPDSPANRLRLEAEASLIASLAAIDRNIASVESSPTDIGEQLLDLYQTIPANGTSLKSTLEHVIQEVATRMKVDGAFVRAYLHGGPEHWCGYGLVPHNRQWLYNCMEQLESEGLPMLQFAKIVPERSVGITNLLLVSLPCYGKTKMVLGFTNSAERAFTELDKKLAEKLGGYAGLRIEYAILSQANDQQAKLEFELNLAERVQKRLLPKKTPRVVGLDMYATTQPASRVGGDFYDFLELPDGSFVFNVCDISGKGVPAALMVAMTRMVIRTIAAHQPIPTPADVVRKSNRELYDDFAQVSMLATLFIGQYQPTERVLYYANAGHSPVVYYNNKVGPRLLEADGTALGVMQDSFSQDQKLKLGPSDVLVVGTDGLSEARNNLGEMFGYDDLMQLVSRLATRPTKVIAEAIQETVKEYANNGALEDDHTLVVFKGV